MNLAHAPRLRRHLCGNPTELVPAVEARQLQVWSSPQECTCECATLAWNVWRSSVSLLQNKLGNFEQSYEMD